MCNGPVLIWWMKYMSIYRICMGIIHCATLWMIAELFYNKRTRRKNIQKARTANPSTTTMLAIAQGQMSCLWKDLNTRKQHVKNISQMYAKNRWGEAHYHATCRRDYTLEDDRHQETIKDTKTIEDQASNKTIIINNIFSTSFSMLWAESFRDKEITTLRKNYETGTFHASSL